MPRYHSSTIQTTPFFTRTTRMPSLRRIRVFGILVLLFVVTVLFYTGSLRQNRTPDSRTVGDLYSRTKSALEKGAGNAGVKSGNNGEDVQVAQQMSERLKEAAQVAKNNANAKAPKPDPPSSVIGKGNSADGASQERGVAGRKKFTTGGGEAQEPVKETQEEHEVEVELNRILKKSPIIIFSKSYCPHSKRAKDILLKKYIIDPEPFVVELDEHPIGPQLQDKLRERTGRRTVPNVLINAVSIGGGDDVAELDANKNLVDKIKELGGKRMKDVRQRPVEPEGPHGLR